MSDMLELVCWVLGSDPEAIMVAKVPRSNYVSILQNKIKKQKPDFSVIEAHQLKLWKVCIPGADLAAVLPGIQSPEHVTNAQILSPMNEISDVFPATPIRGHLHIIVQPPLLNNPNPTPSVLSFPMSRKASRPPIIQEHWTPRAATVSSLYERLMEYRLVQVRGTPGSGKTTLMELLHAHILAHDPGAIVEVIKGWRKQTETDIQTRILTNIKTYPFGGSGNNYLLFDNAQDTYWDEFLWENFFKDVVQHGSGPFAILFCSYGSPDTRPVDYDTGAPPILNDMACISLMPKCNGLGYPPIGLLFFQEEFDQAVDRFKDPDHNFIRVDREFREVLFDWTMGHAGAIGDLLSMLSRLERQTLRDGGKLTVDHLLNIQEAQLSDLSNFSRGLPRVRQLQKPGVTAAFRKLLTQGSIEASDILDEEYCHRRGWVCSEQRSDKTYYTFPSPLHVMYVSWRLIPTDVQCRFASIRDMTFSILRKFNPSQLSSPSRIGVAFSDHPVEARYQFEFYRGLFAATGGGVRICPELLTEKACKGGIDFFIPEKKWGIELTREGNGLLEHSSRFGLRGKYGVWLTSKDVVDYILLDCRTDIPNSANPNIPNLFHAVFEDQFRRLTILNNMLEKVGEPCSLLEG